MYRVIGPKHKLYGISQGVCKLKLVMYFIFLVKLAWNSQLGIRFGGLLRLELG